MQALSRRDFVGALGGVVGAVCAPRLGRAHVDLNIASSSTSAPLLKSGDIKGFTYLSGP